MIVLLQPSRPLIGNVRAIECSDWPIRLKLAVESSGPASMDSTVAIEWLRHADAAGCYLSTQYRQLRVNHIRQ